MLKTKTGTLSISTKGDTEIVDITKKIENVLNESKLQEGVVTVSVVGSTAAITTMEYEQALIKDFKEIFETLIPQNKRYHHDNTWGDANGYAHLRSSIVGSSKTFPFSDGKLLLGAWQQIVLIDFDNRPRHRKIVLQFIGI
ncbi:MAG: secondary thiamine-phosphate synthase enzyme YjbQ [Candidatus Omnitrophica bacterium]|nr:secondary thiamine-phosphate synthase enzyme YjbQ [Candidatus Omnitrophota bacterium]